MEIYQPLKRLDGRWDYTYSNSTGSYPDGYCHEWKWDEHHDLKKHFWISNEEEYQRVISQYLPFRHKYHDDGHATPEEAVACHNEYLVDCDTVVWENPDQQNRCKVCKDWTQTEAMIGRRHVFHLCKEHVGRDFLLDLLNGKYNTDNRKDA